MTDPICFRRAVPSDARDINALIDSLSHYRSPGAKGPPPEEFVAGFSATKIEEHISGGAVSYWVALERDDLVGVIGISTDRRVHHFFVEASFQRRGIARALWERAKTDLLSSIGEDGEAEVVVRSSIYAVPVYKQFGFEATGPAIEGAGVTFVPMCMTLRNRGTTR